MKRVIDPRIWGLGEWLETFLDENIKAADFRRLAEEAFRWLNINYTIREDDPTIALISEIGEKDERLFDNWGAVLNSKIHPLVDDGPLPSDKTMQDIDEQECIERLLEIPALRDTVNKLLHEVSRSDQPWQSVIGMLCEKAAKSAEHVVESEYIEELKRLYSQVNETLVLSNHQLKKINTFTDPRDRGAIPWDVLISRVFFDFLLLAGQERYGFCEHCGKFFMIQRKGRKRFCRDICRVVASREQASR